MDVLLPELHPPHLDEILRNLRHSLLAFVNGKVRPMDQFLVNLLEGFGVVVGQFYALPHVLWRMRSFNRLNIQVQNT